MQLTEEIMNHPLDITGSKSPIKLSDYAGKFVVLYFYPKDKTPGCTIESKDFRDLHNEFLTNNAVILGVSRDSLKSHDSFKEKYEFPFELISDHDKFLCNAFEVLAEKSLFGKKYIGIVRSTFLINPNGQIQQEWIKVSIKGHAQAVLDAIKGSVSVNI